MITNQTRFKQLEDRIAQLEFDINLLESCIVNYFENNAYAHYPIATGKKTKGTKGTNQKGKAISLPKKVATKKRK